MCRNHSHATVENLNVLTAPDGLSVALARSTQDVVLEGSSGERLTLPPGATLLIVVPSTASVSSLPSRVTAALAELLCTDSETDPGLSGLTILPKSPPRSPSYLRN